MTVEISHSLSVKIENDASLGALIEALQELEHVPLSAEADVGKLSVTSARDEVGKPIKRRVVYLQWIEEQS